MAERLDCPPHRARRRRWSAGFSRGSHFSPALAFRRCSILTSLYPHRLRRPRCKEPPRFLLSTCESALSSLPRLAGLTGGLSELRRDVQGVLTSGLCVLCGLERETSSARREIQLLQPNGWYKGPHKGPSTPPALSFGNDERAIVTSQTVCELTGNVFIVLHKRTTFTVRIISRVLFGRLMFCHFLGGRGGVVVRLLASHQGEPGSIPGGPGISHVGIVPDDATCRRVFSGISRFPLPCIPVSVPYSPLFTFIDSQELTVKSRPDFSTRLHFHVFISSLHQADLLWRSRLVFHRARVREGLCSNPGGAIGRPGSWCVERSRDPATQCHVVDTGATRPAPANVSSSFGGPPNRGLPFVVLQIQTSSADFTRKLFADT
ncbi:hypothetical protein PR048_032063 [Dryococelus australis]|uniref:Uncharacterized protein n=1 Tax=Dryococelus australis TaxID=614101 RepID=A0ABQ9G157_9NEOP|nr:hypothetical protein PR048_032063 [Dryococelus australis]